MNLEFVLCDCLPRSARQVVSPSTLGALVLPCPERWLLCAFGEVDAAVARRATGHGVSVVGSQLGL